LRYHVKPSFEKILKILLDDVSPCPLRASDSAREREKGEKERRGRRGGL